MGVYESGKHGLITTLNDAVGCFYSIRVKAFAAAHIDDLAVFYTQGFRVRLFPVHSIYFSVYNSIHLIYPF